MPKQVCTKEEAAKLLADLKASYDSLHINRQSTVKCELIRASLRAQGSTAGEVR